MRGAGGGSRYYRSKARPHFFQDLNLSSILKPADPTEGCFVASKVVATLGPACSDVDTLAQLLEAGMTVARVDLTWGPLDYHKRSLDNLNTAMKRVRRMCAVMVDTLGREMLIRRPFKLGPDGWPQHEQPYKITARSTVTITTRQDAISGPTQLPITYNKFPSLVLPGDIVYIGRYLACGAPEMASLYLKVEQVHMDSGDVICTALNDAELHGLLTVFNLERSTSELVSLQSDLPVLTEYDKHALRELSDSGHGIDFVSISYCRSGADVREVRAFTDTLAGMQSTALVAKVETRQALFNFRGILEACDGIIISRGLLGLDCVPEKVALIQKSLISACNLVGKPVVVTRVLDSMTDSPRPTRAEATDVANAVLDGADALFLGAETLRGKFPVATVRTLVSIARQAEKVFDFRHHFEWLMQAAMDAQELRDALSAGFGPTGFVGAGLDDDDAATDIFMLTGGMGVSGPLSGWGGMGGGGLSGTMGSVGAGLSMMGSAGYGGGGGYGSGGPALGGLTPMTSMGLASGGGGGGGSGGPGGLSPASMSANNLEDLADGEVASGGGGGGAGGGGGSGGGAAAGGGNGHHHVSFAALPPRAPSRTRSNISMPDLPVVVGPGGGGSGGGSGGGGAATGLNGGGLHGAAAGTLLPGPAGGGGGGSGGGATTGAGTSTPAQPASRSQSYADINTAVAAMARFGSGPRSSTAGEGSHHGAAHPPLSHHLVHHASGRASPSVRSTTGTLYGGGPSGPYMGKLESIASSAVRAAEKVKASLIVVYTHTSKVASLVAKYRPPMPILTLVVPRLTSDGLHWRLQGRGHARQCLMVRGLLPMLSAPGPSGDEVLEEAIAMASRLGLVGPGHHVVVVERVHDAFCLKIVAVDELGLGIQRDGPVDPAAVVVRAMVPATPVVGRTLSMMNDARLPPAAALMAAAAWGSGGAAAGLDISPRLPSQVMGTITSLLSPTPSSYGAYGGGYSSLAAEGPGGAAAAAAGNGGGSGGRGPRRMTSRELISAVSTSPFSGSPPVGVGLAAPPPGAAATTTTCGGGGCGIGGIAARANLLNTLLTVQQGQQQAQHANALGVAAGGSGGGGGAVTPGIIASSSGGSVGGSTPAGISLASRPVLNALGGGPAAQDGLLAAGGLNGVAAAPDAAAAVALLPLARGLLGAVAEEPEGISPFLEDVRGRSAGAGIGKQGKQQEEERGGSGSGNSG